MNGRIRIAHEAPTSIFEEVNKVTDYSYALVHLLEENSEYRKKFEKAKADGRMIYLDTSIFELGTAFDPDKFAGWVKRLEPDYYFVPDVLEDGYETMRQMSNWNQKYRDLPGERVGVVQGTTFVELMECYRYMDEVADVNMIAISFDYSYYRETFPHPNKYVSWMMGRVKFLGDLYNHGIINVNKKHHLLGTALPVEGKFYRDYKWVYSVDTSNPVVAGIKGKRYEQGFGLYTKESQKLFTMINENLSEKQVQDILYNIWEFRDYWNPIQ